MVNTINKKISILFSRFFKTLLILSFIISVSNVFFTKKASACGFCLAALAAADNPLLWGLSQRNFDEYLDREFKRVESFFIEVLWAQGILPVMMEAAAQFTAVALHQSMMIGMFIDAEIQLDTQRLLQEIRAKAYKDYKPSISMCEFGSLSKSLATSELHGDTFAVILSHRSQDRQLGKGESSGTYGGDLEHNNRILQFTKLFCNEKDRNSALETVCDARVDWSNTSFDASARKRMNKDIDYYSLMDLPWTLKINFNNQQILDDVAVPPIHDEDEEHIMAMASNLFGHNTFARPPARLLANNPDPNTNLNNMQKLYMDMRSIIAKRSVAENSFYAIASMKSSSPLIPDISGGPNDVEISSRKYMEHILEQLGVSSTPEILSLLGENPSYYAQMEILTKKIYQSPNFYTNLYEAPTNIDRKTVALQAIKLMQKFDMLKSVLRGEATISILLEVAVAELQQEIENQIQTLGGGD